MKQHSRDGEAAGKTGNKRLNIYFRCEAAHRARSGEVGGGAGRKKPLRIHPSTSIFPLYIAALSLVINGVSAGILC